MRELNPYSSSPLLSSLTLSHQSYKEESEICGEKLCRLTCERKQKQNFLAKV
jgi:hypothetical protein